MIKKIIKVILLGLLLIPITVGVALSPKDEDLIQHLLIYTPEATLHRLLMVQEGYTANSKSHKTPTYKIIYKLYKKAHNKKIDAQMTHDGKSIGYFTNIQIIKFRYKQKVVRGLVGDFVPTIAFAASKIYSQYEYAYEHDLERRVQLSISFYWVTYNMRHCAFVSKGAWTNDFRITDREVVRR